MFDGEGLASTIVTSMYLGACLLRHWVECLRSERLRVELRQLHLVLRMRELAKVVAIEMVMMAMTGEIAMKVAQ